MENFICPCCHQEQHSFAVYEYVPELHDSFWVIFDCSELGSGSVNSDLVQCLACGEALTSFFTDLGVQLELDTVAPDTRFLGEVRWYLSVIIILYGAILLTLLVG